MAKALTVTKQYSSQRVGLFYCSMRETPQRLLASEHVWLLALRLPATASAVQ